MTEDIKNFKVNWIDGMKISKEHFQQLQSYTWDTIRDMGSVRMGRFDYGAIASSSKNTNEFLINIDAHNNLKVAIKVLKAVTPNGNRVEITAETPSFKEDITVEELSNSGFDGGYVLLNVDTENSVAFGTKNPKEMPPRLPFLTANYFVTFITASDMESEGVSSNQIPIAKIERREKGLLVAQQYIMPAVTLAADQGLTKFYGEIETFFKMTERNAIQIVQKIRSKDNDNIIADTLFVAVDKIYTLLGTELTRFKCEEYDLTPRELINSIVSFARLFKNAVDVAPSQHKEQLFNYFAEWTDLKGGDYEKLFTNVINLTYNHNDIEQNISVLKDFTGTINKLFTLLTQVDYIGKRKDMGIFVNENSLKENTNKSKIGGSSSPSFLAE